MKTTTARRGGITMQLPSLNFQRQWWVASLECHISTYTVFKAYKWAQHTIDKRPSSMLLRSTMEKIVLDAYFMKKS